MATTQTQPAAEAVVDAAQADRLDGFVERAAAAAESFRRLDQEAVDEIVWAMVVAGLDSAVELAELAMEETGFGVFEDKVVKNYIATEFLYDYLKDKRSVGVIDEDPERASSTSPSRSASSWRCCRSRTRRRRRCSSRSWRRKTRNAIVFRPSARAAGCAVRAVEILQAAGEAAGLPADALQVIPDPTLDVSQYLFHHAGDRPDLDDRRAEERSPLRTRPASRRSASAPATRRSTCTAAPTSAWRSSTC